MEPRWSSNIHDLAFWLKSTPEMIFWEMILFRIVNNSYGFNMIISSYVQTEQKHYIPGDWCAPCNNLNGLFGMLIVTWSSLEPEIFQLLEHP